MEASLEGTRPPDFLLLQLGYWTCVKPYASDNPDTNFIKNSEANIKTFFTALKAATQKSAKNTTVIISLASRGHLHKWEADYCTWRLNRIIAYEAHTKGFIVLEREEVETRLLFRTERDISPIKTPKALLEFPGSQIIAASLTTLLNCLEQNVIFQI